MNNYLCLVNYINGGNFMRQKIKCDVYDCRHCDIMNEACALKEIKVGRCKEDKAKESTMCDSYDKTD